MMKTNKILFLLLVLSTFSACASADEPADEPAKEAPKFLHSIPANQAVGVELNSNIELVFNEAITLSSNHGITINNHKVQVKAQSNKLICEPELTYETQCVLSIPQGAVKNQYGVPLNEKITIEFTTEDNKLAEQDPAMYIYLCFGQSNMVGQGAIEAQDKDVNERFKVFQSLNCTNLAKDKEQWYTAVPPLCDCYCGLSPVDYFGRTMVEHLPENISVGVIVVAIGGCDIRIFDKDIHQQYHDTYTEDWFQNAVKHYNQNPNQYLINLAKKAQEQGVIKGILLHQGETNTGDQQWPQYVSKIYNDMLQDLDLQASDVPLLAGEVVSVEGSCCSAMNTIINQLPETVPTAHIISSEGCTAKDNAHFDAKGYRILGKRYAQTMLSLMGIQYAEE